MLLMLLIMLLMVYKHRKTPPHKLRACLRAAGIVYLVMYCFFYVILTIEGILCL